MKDGVGKRKDSLFPAFFFLALNTAFSPALLQDRAVALAISAASACERRREKSFPCPSFSIAKGGRRQLGPDEKRYGLPPSLRRREGKNWDFHPLKRKEAILESGPFFFLRWDNSVRPKLHVPELFSSPLARSPCTVYPANGAGKKPSRGSFRNMPCMGFSTFLLYLCILLRSSSFPSPFL